MTQGLRRTRSRSAVTLMLLGLAVASRLILFPSATQARPCPNCRHKIVVSTLLDDSGSGDELCSLREAINNANAKSDTTDGDCAAGNGTDTIVFSVSGTITLASELPVIANAAGDSLMIDGTAQSITIAGGMDPNPSNILEVDSSATLVLKGLTLANGNSAHVSNDGGAIINNGTLTISASTLTGNVTIFEGGAIFNAGTLTITDSTLSNNISVGGEGGAIANDVGATLTISNSILSDNFGQSGGGAISNSGTATVTNCTILGNNSAAPGLQGSGGGIDNDGTLTISGSTFTSNRCDQSGAAIFNDGLLTVMNSTFFKNAVQPTGFGGGIVHISEPGSALTVVNSSFSENNEGSLVNSVPAEGGGPVTVTNSVFVNSASGPNCAGRPLTNTAYNMSDDGSCGFGTTLGSNAETIGDNVRSPLVANDLQDNGGPTETIALEPGSPAIAAIPLADCTVTTDQRGAARPAPGFNACDIGAFEYGGLVPKASPTPQATRTSTPTPTATPTATRTPTPTATPTPSMVILMPTSLDFGTESVGKTSPSQTITLLNATSKQITIRLTTIGRDFAVAGTTCSATLSAGGSCSYSIKFKPLSAGPRNETFKVTTNASTSSPSANLHGVGTSK